MTLDKYLLEVREREGKATRGEWRGRDLEHCTKKYRIIDGPRERVIEATFIREATEEFITHARTDIPRLVKLLEKATRQLFLVKIACMSHLDPNATGTLNVEGVKAEIEKCLAELDRLASGEKCGG